MSGDVSKEPSQKVPQTTSNGFTHVRTALEVLAVALVFVALFKDELKDIFRAKDPQADSVERKVQFAVEQAGIVCLSGFDQTTKRGIETSVVNATLAKGSRSEDTIRRYIGTEIAANDALKSQENKQSCMQAQVPIMMQWYDAKGTQVTVPGQVSADPSLSGGAIGFIYYEENSGRPTEDGVFSPVAGGRLRPYNDLTTGTVLKTLSGAQLRSGPDSLSPIVRTLAGNQCVKLLEGTIHPVAKLLHASSGGRINVQAISCPSDTNGPA